LCMLDQLAAEDRSVDGIRRLMKQLCEALEALAEGVSLAAPDTVRALLARRKEIVPILDERLTKSAELIRKGLRDEAVNYAIEPPDLLQAATLLDISRHARWKIWLAKLNELNIPTPPMPRMDLVATLTNAQAELVRLKPLLDSWRRMNLANAPLADRIAMLRKLRKADPENELWFEALQEHQKQRLPGLERDVAAAAQAQDDQRLAALVAEMRQEWIEPVPKRILAAATSALERFRGTRIDRELDSLADSLAAAHDAKDLDAARTLRDRWQELTDQKGSFAVDDPRLTAAQPAVDWVDAHARMAAVSEELWNSLDARPGGLRMRREWVRSLERLGNEMEDLAEKLEGDADGASIERAHERIGRQRAQLERDLRFRRMMMYVGIASTAVVVGLTVWYFDKVARHDRSVATALRDLRAAQEKIAAGELLELPDFPLKWPAEVASDPKIASLFATVRGEHEKQVERRHRLNAMLQGARERLQAAETADRKDPLEPWPPAFAETARQITEIEAAKLVATDQERADTARVKAALDRLAKRFIGAADDVCRQRITHFDAELGKARETLATDSDRAIRAVSDVKAAIAALRQQAATRAVAEGSASHAGLRIASEAVIALLTNGGPLLSKAEAIEGMQATRNRFREAEKELDRRLGDWRLYAEQLEAIARDYATFPESRDYSRAVESKSLWPAVDAWRGFQPGLQQLHVASPEKARDTIAGFESLPAETKDLSMAKRFRQEVLPAIQMLADRDLEKLRDDFEKWFSGTWLEDLKYIVRTQDELLYYCLVGPQEGAAQFKYVSGQKDAEAGWPTKVAVKTAQTVAQSPQLRLAETLRSLVRKADPSGGLAVDELFLALIQATVEAKNVDPVPRLITARKLLLLAAENSRPWREAGRRLSKLLDDGQGGIPGLAVEQLWTFVPPNRDENPEYQLTKQKAERLLQEIQFGLAAAKDAIAKEQRTLTALTTGKATLVGRLGRNEAGELVGIWRGPNPPAGRLWWFSTGSEAAVAGTVDEQGGFRPGLVAGPAGTPLFTMEE
jgi:hypothetical protein